ncbi:MAG: murein biosynthesis integral membrane protein MurJ [Holophagales bacterium]|nr:murein biosynthesis integral membrane protein MurJ [Holophagales bacterium]
MALGILSSKVFGLGREMVLSRYLGVGPHNDVLRSALRAPNLLQNLLGEQTLSAAFIPIYSRLLEEGREEEAGRFAGAIFGLMVLVVSTLVLLGMWLAPYIVAVLSAGYLRDAELVAEGVRSVDRYVLQVQMVRLIFPMSGMMVLAAWAMGVLNSHRRFFLPYMAPAFWNLSILAFLFAAAWRSGHLRDPGAAGLETLTTWLHAICVGALVGGALQLLVQLPLVLRLCPGLRISFFRRVAGVREAVRAFGPAVAGRGIVQLSLYLDNFLATFLAPGAPGAIQYAGVLINLPLGAFGMSVAAAELPEMSRSDPGKISAEVSARVDRAMRQSAFLICPSVLGYLIFGQLVVGLVYRGGEFGRDSQILVWAVLAGYTLGLLASATSRLLQNTFFALRDTRTPALVATVRLLASATLGWGLMTWLDRYSVAASLGSQDPGGLFYGACGLALAASVGAWAELALLVRSLRRRLPGLSLPAVPVLATFGRSAVAALPALGLWWLLRGSDFRVQAMVVLGAYAATYLGWAARRRAPELEMWVGRLRVRRRG